MAKTMCLSVLPIIADRMEKIVLTAVLICINFDDILHNVISSDRNSNVSE